MLGSVYTCRGGIMVLDLKGMREAAGLNQGELGESLGLSQAQISRYEADPGSLSMELARRWCENCGTSLDVELLKAAQKIAAENDRGLDVGEPYAGFNRRLGLLEQYIESAPDVDASLPPLSFSPQDLRAKIYQWRQKPTVLIAGRFDSGKTRIANTLLGGNMLPSQYQPTTSVATYIRHESERPKWQKEDVWIMGKDFDPTSWNDEKSCQTHRLISGGFETLRRFGTKESDGESLGAKFALIYVDSPILRACTLIDVPGYSDQYEEERIANASAMAADILVYTAPANGFLDTSDFLHLGLLLRSLPDLSAKSKFEVNKLANFFIVATHADHKYSDKEIESILDGGSVRLHRQFKDSILADRNVSQGELRGRFCTFWYETPKRRAVLEAGIRQALSEVMPEQIELVVNSEIRAIKAKAKEFLAAQIAAYERTLSECEAAQRAIVQLRDYEPEFRKRIRQKKKEIREKIESLRVNSVTFIHDEISPMTTTSSIESFIIKEFPKKDEAKKDAFAKLLEDAQSTLEKFLEGESKKLTAVIDDFLKEYEDTLGQFASPEFGSFAIPFDTVAAFAGGLAGLGTLGALGIWASMMGNLGGYILVAKLASVLSAVGLGVSSVGLVTFVAAIGGPVTLAIGLASLLTLGVWALLSDSWQRRLAKKFAKTLDEQGFLKKYEEGVNAFWDQTWSAFEAGADGIDKKFGQYLSTNEQLVNDAKGGSKEKIEKTIETLEELRDFFAGIPWRSPA